MAVFSDKNPSRWTDRELVGIYLSGANDKGMYSPGAQESRTRRNGKFSHQRERV